MTKPHLFDGYNGTPVYDKYKTGGYEFTGSLILPDEVTNPDDKIAIAQVYLLPPQIIIIESIEEFDGITVDYGTEKTDIELPSEISITLTDGTTLDIDVTWDDGTPDYDKDSTGGYEFLGTLDLPTGIQNMKELVAEIIVTVLKEKVDPKQPTESEDPEITEPSDDDSGKVHIDSRDDQSKGGTKNKLPKTATPFYNLLLMGSLLVVTGTGVFIWRKRLSKG